jgi:hypothetical protein
MERWKGTQMKNKQALAVLAGGLAMLGACASGNRDVGHEASAPRVLYSADALVFVSFDANDDLLVDAGEIEAGVTREWARADTSGDGMLAPLEYGAWAESALGGNQLPPFRLDFDRNVDNSISETEFRTEFAARVTDYDANGDGVLSRGEMLRAVAQPRLLRDTQPIFDPERERRRRPPQ